MKVYIGKYPNDWWTTRLWREKIIARRHGKEFCFEVKEEDYDWVDRAIDRFSDFWQDVLNVTINQIVKHRKQKIKIRIDPHDTWSMDHTLSYIIHPMLIQLKNTNHGSGFVDDEDVPEHLRTTAATPLTEDEKETGHTDELWSKRWDYVMDEMIYAFEMKLKGDWDMEIWHRGGDYWDDEKFAERKAIQDRISNGFRLFGKYYEGLWD